MCVAVQDGLREGAGVYRYTFGGKEFNADFGLKLNDFGARWYDPAIARWTATDPAGSSYSTISPFAYVANNPMLYIDPTGAYIEEGSQKEWEKQTGNVEKIRDKLQGKLSKLQAKGSEKGWSSEKVERRTGGLAERVNSLNSTISTFASLESSSQGYSLTKASSEVTGLSYGSDGVIDIKFSTTANFVHESTHAGQFEGGEVAFDGSSGNTLLQDVGDEVAAYKAQYAYNPSSVSGLTSSSSINSFSSITSAWVQGITTSSGDKIYAPGGSSNTGAHPVNINSTRADFIRAYPQQISLGLLSKKWTPTQMKNIIYKKQ